MARLPAAEARAVGQGAGGGAGPSGMQARAAGRRAVKLAGAGLACHHRRLARPCASATFHRQQRHSAPLCNYSRGPAGGSSGSRSRSRHSVRTCPLTLVPTPWFTGFNPSQGVPDRLPQAQAAAAQGCAEAAGEAAPGAAIRGARGGGCWGPGTRARCCCCVVLLASYDVASVPHALPAWLNLMWLHKCCSASIIAPATHHCLCSGAKPSSRPWPWPWKTAVSATEACPLELF